MERTSGGVTNRRYSALQRLEAQLQSGNKNLTRKRSLAISPEGGPLTTELLLTDGDRSRIDKEIYSLKVNLGLIAKPQVEVKTEVVKGEKPAPVSEKLTNQQSNRNLLDSKAK